MTVIQSAGGSYMLSAIWPTRSAAGDYAASRAVRAFIYVALSTSGYVEGGPCERVRQRFQIRIK